MKGILLMSMSGISLVERNNNPLSVDDTNISLVSLSVNVKVNVVEQVVQRNGNGQYQ